MLEITVRLNPSLKEWFIEKVSRDPQWLVQKWFPSLEMFAVRLNNEVRQANKAGDPSRIAYAQGRFDGVQDFLGLLGGIKLSDAEKPVGTGLMSRMIGIGRK